MAGAASPRLDSSSSDEEQDEEVAHMVKDNLDQYLRTGQAEYLLHEPYMRDFENQLRERLREEHVRLQAAMSETKRNTEVQLLSFPNSFLDRRLPALLQMTDNPDSVEVFFSRLAQLGEDGEEDSDEKSNGGDGAAGPRFNEVIDGAGVRTGSDVKGWLKQTADAKANVQSNPRAPTPADTVAADDFVTVREDAVSTSSSDELYSTPVSSMAPRHLFQPPAANQGDGNVRVTKTAHRRKGNSPAPAVPPAPGIPAVFQFMGDPNKEPRMVQPGEILYSATGSPITIPGTNPEPSSTTSTFSSQPGTTPPSSMRRGRPVKLTVDNPNGTALRVEVICREGAEDVFRNFVTDIRGFITTRSLMHQRYLPPRVPAPSKVASATGKKQRKPIWKN